LYNGWHRVYGVLGLCEEVSFQPISELVEVECRYDCIENEFQTT